MSDTCAGQFRSQFCNFDLQEKKKVLCLQHVTNHFFEPHEGKNISDTIGSIAKGAFNRGKAKKDVGISGISQVVQIIRENVREKTEKFSFFIVEEMEPCRRPEKGEQKPKGLLLPGISKFLYIYFNSNGSGIVL